MKRCPQCGDTKPTSDFGNNSARRDGLASYCKPCTASNRRNKRRANPDATREQDRARYATNRNRINTNRRTRYATDPSYRKKANEARRKSEDPEKAAVRQRKSLLKQYGLTLEQYDDMVDAVGGVCPVCLDAPKYAGKPRRLVVDHDHRTGKIRGLLCWRCNGAVGIIGEDNLHRMLEYLRAAESSG